MAASVAGLEQGYDFFDVALELGGLAKEVRLMGYQEIDGGLELFGASVVEAQIAVIAQKIAKPEELEPGRESPFGDELKIISQHEARALLKEIAQKMQRFSRELRP